MDSPARAPQRNPQAEYQRRMEELRAAEVVYKSRDDRLAYTILLLIISAIAVAIWLLFSKSSLYWAGIPLAVFIFFAVIHSRVLRALRDCRRAIAFYERGLARLNNRWIGTGQNGERFLDSKHPYARDLDIFGSGSVFELLCTARTCAGEQMLASWLLTPAIPEEVLLRQAAVNEMRDRLRFREELAVLSEGIDAAGRPDAFTAWGESGEIPAPKYLRILLPLLAAIWATSLVGWIGWGFWYAAVGISAINALIASRLSKRYGPHALAIENAVHDVQFISEVLERMEKEPFSSSKLSALQRALSRGEHSASERVARLARLTDSLRSRRSYLVALLNPFIFWSAQFVLAIHAWRRSSGSEIRGWLAALGEMEALSDLAGYSYEHPHDIFPEFTNESPCYEAEGLAHPLMPESSAVRNDLVLGRELRVVIISGPNMAGKSTFVRAVGVNAVLAQCGAPVRAKRLRISRLAIAASVCVLDSLQGGISRFYAEITRLKLIMDMAQKPTPVLFLLDELLSGTNSHDRRVGAEALVRALFQRNAVGLVTTHDLSLAEIAKLLGDRVANAHFEDHLDDGKLRFDYRLTPGVVQTSNALELMRSIGLDV
ncbi:MAG: MutS-related protein [Candidatus Acidiferrales bacterium]